MFLRMIFHYFRHDQWSWMRTNSGGETVNRIAPVYLNATSCFARKIKTRAKTVPEAFSILFGKDAQNGLVLLENLTPSWHLCAIFFSCGHALTVPPLLVGSLAARACRWSLESKHCTRGWTSANLVVLHNGWPESEYRYIPTRYFIRFCMMLPYFVWLYCVPNARYFVCVCAA